MRMFLPAFFVALLPAPASAGEIEIPLPPHVEVSKTDVTYACSDRELTVAYFNAGAVALAVFDINGETVVASNVIAASGAKYAGAQYVWWTKGDDADLYDLMRGDEDTPAMKCVAKG